MEMTPNLTRDRLSDLPDGILENIFFHLKIRDVVRTSILSTKWRYKWVSSPYLIFNEQCIPRGLFGVVGHRKFVEIVNHVLRTHSGPILTFKVSSNHLEPCSEINSWILSLPLDSLTELQIQTLSVSSRPYSVPPSLFSFEHLIDLELNCCMIPLPPLAFKGFRRLTRLFLQYVTLSDETLECMLSSCPELEYLTLGQIEGPTHIQLSNQKLKYFSYGKSSIDTVVCCMIPLPPSGFKCLTTLSFIGVTLSDETLECLLSSCPELEELSLLNIGGLSHIQLFNPKLKYLDICGNFLIDTCLEDLKNVADATFRPEGIFHLDEVEDCNFGHVLGFLVGIEELCLGEYFLQSLPFLDVPRRLPSTYYHLMGIDVTLNVEDRKEVLGAICLLNSSPNLKELTISLQHEKQSALFLLTDLQEVKDWFESSFNKLLVVRINHFVGTEVDLVITKSILANSPVLELMNIRSSEYEYDITKEVTLLRKLIQFKRASSEAEIELCLMIENQW